GNAIKYTSEEGTITVILGSKDGFVIFACHDTGTGIPKGKQYTIFNKFERHHLSKEGTGLGLAITKDLVEMHRGAIWVESQEGKGSKFTIALPQDAREEEGEEGGE
ncbi:MAG: ATP-binding protein, partial [Candidatus Omnitrophota bacterium]